MASFESNGHILNDGGDKTPIQFQLLKDDLEALPTDYAFSKLLKITRILSKSYSIVTHMNLYKKLKLIQSKVQFFLDHEILNDEHSDKRAELAELAREVWSDLHLELEQEKASFKGAPLFSTFHNAIHNYHLNAFMTLYTDGKKDSHLEDSINPEFISILKEELKKGNPIQIDGVWEGNANLFAYSDHEIIMTGLKKVSCKQESFYAIKVYNSWGGSGNSWVKLKNFLTYETKILYLKKSKNIFKYKTHFNASLSSNSAYHMLESIAELGDINLMKISLEKLSTDEWEEHRAKTYFSALENGHIPLAHFIKRYNTSKSHPLTPDELDPRTDGNRTPLMNAAYYGNAKVVKTLLDLGADKNLTSDYGENTLFSALLGGSFHVAQLISRYKSESTEPLSAEELSPRAMKGYTPFMVACEENEYAIAKEFIARGIDFDLKNDDGDTALDLARKAKNESIIELIEKEIKKNKTALL